MPTKLNSLSQLRGVSDKRACLVATVGNIAFTGITQIDGVTLSNDDRVLVWQQSTPSQNGIYILSGSTNLVRTVDSKNVSDFTQGTQYFVVSGNTYNETLFYLKNKVTTLGVDDIIIDIFGGLNGTSGTSGSSGASGSSGTSGSNAGITSYTNPADNRVITSVSATEINAETNLTFDGSILDVNTTAALKIPVGTTEERPTLPSNGMIRLNTTLGGLEVYDSDWYLFFYTRLVIDYLIIAGGGGGASTGGGGGGAGGYRTTVGTSGGNSSSESKVTLTRGVQYVITVGAGAPQNSGNVDNGFSGSNSSISGSGLTSIISIGGGGGSRSTGINGGSGGGGCSSLSGGTATINQGFNGGSGFSAIGGGGGGASTTGVSATSNSGGNGGNGLSNNITGTSIVRAGGGGGGNHLNSIVGSGGIGGGGTASPFGSANARGGAGTINTGSGGGGGSGQTGVNYGFGGAGGSGIVVIKTPIIASSTTGSPTITSFGVFYIYQFTGTGTITF